jgi:hypothetical protein
MVLYPQTTTTSSEAPPSPTTSHRPNRQHDRSCVTARPTLLAVPCTGDLSDHNEASEILRLADRRIFMLERRRRGGIFGRDLDLAAMERFLDSASMWPSAIVIEGDAGTGNNAVPRGGQAARSSRRGDQ